MESTGALIAIVSAIAATASSIVAGVVTYLTNRSQKNRDRVEEEALRRRRDMREAIARYLLAARKAGFVQDTYTRATDEEKNAANDELVHSLIQVELLSPEKIAVLARKLFDTANAVGVTTPDIWMSEANRLWTALLAAVREELRAPLS